MFKSEIKTSKEWELISNIASETVSATWTSNPACSRTGGRVRRMLASSSTNSIRFRGASAFIRLQGKVFKTLQKPHHYSAQNYSVQNERRGKRRPKSASHSALKC